MRKVRLDVAGLCVESFTIAEKAVARGTVRAREGTFDCTGYGTSCSGSPACICMTQMDPSCFGPCQ